MSNNNCPQQLQRIWVIDLIWKWFCVWDALANLNNLLNLVPNRYITRAFVVILKKQNNDNL